MTWFVLLCLQSISTISSQWRHLTSERHGVSVYRQLNVLFRTFSNANKQKKSKLHIGGCFVKIIHR